MDKDEKYKLACVKFGIIAPVLNNTHTFKSNNQYFQHVVSVGWFDHRGKLHSVGTSTLRDWVNAYLEKGLDGLISSCRNDKGTHQFKMEEAIEFVTKVLKNNNRMPATEVYRLLNQEGINNISLSSVNRIVNDVKKSFGMPAHNQMLRYEMPHINEVWCGDSTPGPYLYVEKLKIRLHIIALIDDCSRMIVGCDIFTLDNTVNLINVMKQAVTIYGKPKMFNFDNGSNYASLQTKIIGARIGSIVHYDPPYTPTSKAKIERWYKTLKMQWMSTLSYRSFKSLEEYRVSLKEYVNRYNNTIHSSLDGKSPRERYMEELEYISKIKPDKIDSMFLFEITKKASIDCIVTIDKIEYEVPQVFSKSTVTIRYSTDFEKVYVVDSNEKLIEIFKVDKVANSKIKRNKLS